MQHLTESLNLFRQNPRLWSYSIRPMMWAGLLFLLVVVAGYFAVAPAVRDLVQRLAGTSPGVANLLATGVYLLLWVFLAGTVFLAIASFLSSLAWEKLSTEVEELVHGHAPSFVPSKAAIAVDSLSRLVFSLLVAVLALCCGLFTAGVVGIVAAGLIGLFDFTSTAYARRGILFAGQWSRVFRLRGWATFLLGVGLLSLVPLVNVVMLPVMVAAGTIMVARSEST